VSVMDRRERRERTHRQHIESAWLEPVSMFVGHRCHRCERVSQGRGDVLERELTDIERRQCLLHVGFSGSSLRALGVTESLVVAETPCTKSCSARLKYHSSK
jgi:hypothetical protein